MKMIGFKVEYLKGLADLIVGTILELSILHV